MKKQSVIIFNKVTKSYQITKGKYGLLIEKLGDYMNFLNRGRNTKEDVEALKGVSFEIQKGETIGIIGRNGAGKSTILKLISKITYPQSGRVDVEGKIGAFIELGAGLHPELTGRENIYLYGAILGMKKKEIEQNFEEIINFAEIKKFLDIPIKKYSSGMYSRLGFSVCAFSNPDILLVDEVLAVGDIKFQQKCLNKMRSFSKEKTVIFVSHNLEAIKSICSRVIYIEKGRIRKVGKPNEVVNFYIKHAKSRETI